MFHKAIDLEFKEGTALEVTFQNGDVKRYDMSALFSKYPQLRALENRELFLSGKLAGMLGIIWNDDLDLSVETVYECGELVRKEKVQANMLVADAVAEARSKVGLTQAQLAAATGIDQSDISRIERGVGNPSINTLSRIAKALDAELNISIS
ncbi:MAG: helix-turn-helix domain-containing protein [Bacillota bacterium]